MTISALVQCSYYLSSRLVEINLSMMTLHFRNLHKLPSVLGCLTRALSSRAAAAAADTKIYEYRQYSVKPECLRKYMQLTKEKFHLRLTHSKMLAFFTVELGGLNQVVHLWEYDSYEQRRKVREKLANDSQWLSEYAHLVGPMLSQQTNATLRKVPGWGIGLEQEGGEKYSYEMRIRTLKPGAEDLVQHRLQESLLYHPTPPHMLALWRGEFGPSPSLYSLHRFATFDGRGQAITKDLQNEQMRETKKFLDTHSLTVSLLALHSTPWSPLQ